MFIVVKYKAGLNCKALNAHRQLNSTHVILIRNGLNLIGNYFLANGLNFFN